VAEKLNPQVGRIFHRNTAKKPGDLLLNSICDETLKVLFANPHVVGLSAMSDGEKVNVDLEDFTDEYFEPR